MKRFVIILAVSLLFLTGLNALVAGGFILDPSGAKIGMTTEYLRYSPFRSFLIPGIVLFLVNGVLNILAGYVVLKKWRRAPELVLLQGVLLGGWIMVQVAMVRDLNALHIIMFSIGVLLIACGYFMHSAREAR